MTHVSRVTTFLLLVMAVLALPAGAAETSGSVNINTASAEQLMYLPRVGPSVAGRIPAGAFAAVTLGPPSSLGRHHRRGHPGSARPTDQTAGS